MIPTQPPELITNPSQFMKVQTTWVRLFPTFRVFSALLMVKMVSNSPKVIQSK